MLKPIIKYRATAYRYELWGNLRDGFDVNNEHSCPNSQQNFLKPPTVKQITGIAKDAFEGFSFALSEGKSTYIPRSSVKLDHAYNNNISDETRTYFEYRGQQIGFVHVEEIQVFPKHHIARVMDARGSNYGSSLTTDPDTSIERALVAAKLLAVKHSLNRIEVDTINNGQVVGTVEYEWRNKGDELIGVRGDKAPSDGWYNLSK